MKNIHFILIILFIPIFLNSYIFEVDRFESLIFITSAVAVDLSNNYFDRQYIEVPTDLDLETLTTDNIPFFDKLGLQPYSLTLKNYSDYAAYLAASTAFYCIFEKNPKLLLNNLIVYGEIMITQSLVSKWTKTLTHRYRPFVYLDDVPNSKKMQRNSQHSFYSMHSSSTFASATYGYYYYYKNYGHNVFIGSLLFGAASATAALRVASGQHFPSDVIVGAIIGSGTSYFFCKFHENKRIKLSFGYDSIDISYSF